ncbi:hypothetical protein [Parasitella parasitica]|uniref:carboxypeptidase C n=1 Tax=Parasitella parasitica TaxID=35722 RepID=A0A0B7NEZ1_9FUNG|nr:hypothetical protein [Parasitella parasitica]
MMHGEFDCSSVMDSWFQTGPCLVKMSSGIEANPFSFNHISNLLYIDLPSNVGFSHRLKGKATTSNANVVESIYEFLQFFFTEFKEFSHNEFHISGSAYDAQYVPPLAARIIRENRYALSKNKIPIQLNSIILGNGLIYPRVQDLSYVDYACDSDNEQCNQTQLDPFIKTGINPYDIRKKCTYQYQRPGTIPRYCYPDIASVEYHANQQQIRTEYGVDSEASPYRYCSAHRQAERNFDYDIMNSGYKSTMLDIEKILATSVRVLVYVGDMNYKYNWRGQKTWLSQLDWVGQVEFNKASDKDWISYVSGTKAGVVKTYQNIAFVKVFDAGQFVVAEYVIDLLNDVAASLTPLGNLPEEIWLLRPPGVFGSGTAVDTNISKDSNVFHKHVLTRRRSNYS